MLWVKLGCMPDPHQASPPFCFLNWTGVIKMEDNSQIEISSLLKQKLRAAFSQREKENSLLFIDKYYLATSQETGRQALQWLLWNINTVNNKCSLLPPSFLSFYIWAGVMWFGISLWLTWSAGLVLSSSRILPTPCLLVRDRILERQHWCRARDPHQ